MIIVEKYLNLKEKGEKFCSYRFERWYGNEIRLNFEV